MHKHQDHTEGSIVILLDRVRELDLAQMGLKKEEEVNQKLVHDAPSFLVLGEEEVRKEHPVGDKLEPGERETYPIQKMFVRFDNEMKN